LNQLSLFDQPIENTPIKKVKESKIKVGGLYNIDGYKEPGTVIYIMDTWVQLDAYTSPCSYARIEDLTPKQ